MSIKRYLILILLFLIGVSNFYARGAKTKMLRERMEALILKGALFEPNKMECVETSGKTAEIAVARLWLKLNVKI